MVANKKTEIQKIKKIEKKIENIAAANYNGYIGSLPRVLTIGVNERLTEISK